MQRCSHLPHGHTNHMLVVASKGFGIIFVLLDMLNIYYFYTHITLVL